MLKRRMIPILLMFLLAGCVSSGDFCDVYSPVTMGDGLAVQMVETERQTAEAIAANQIYYGRNCGG